MLFSVNVSRKQYLYKYKTSYIIIRFWKIVIIPYHIVDYYMNTIYEMRNEMDFFNRCKKFVYNHDFVKVSWKIDDAI